MNKSPKFMNQQVHEQFMKNVRKSWKVKKTLFYEQFMNNDFIKPLFEIPDINDIDTIRIFNEVMNNEHIREQSPTECKQCALNYK